MNNVNHLSAAAPHLPQIRLYQNWLRDERGLIVIDCAFCSRLFEIDA